MMSRESGRSIELLEHIKQSIVDILFTPIGSRIMRREYGSLIFRLMDSPFNDATRLQVMAATATAIATWEDRIELTSTKFTEVENGQFVILLDGQLVGTNQNFNLSIPLVYGSTI
ncbi:GPW/gp25 family protein [Acinetobacter bereziniae]|uniref:GPW/gp25 family protein n=1 Tax=Acinetobacter bereziniae TaxID=106648 RepID=UPI0021D132E6|nr:GPW/gp25 family protein [Acinetobacter bereziniae]MCU4317119.1 GPW/gp25 family protein [Acinetobacter bereziniae]MCV2441889.1 GPW/gp25 family protein [Acinetobacter bereziniae]